MTTSGEFKPLVCWNDGETTVFLDGCTLVLPPDEHFADERAAMEKAGISFPSDEWARGPTSVSQVADLIPAEGGFRLKWTDGPFHGATLSLSDWRYITLQSPPPRSHDDGSSLVFADTAAAEWAARQIIIKREIEFRRSSDVSREMLPRAAQTSYHVTERQYVSDIIQNGFIGGWGDVGFGVYFYGAIYLAQDYAAEGGWDNKLEDPMILAVLDREIEHVTDLDPSWDARLYTDMHWHPMDEDSEDERWKPAKIEVVG